LKIEKRETIAEMKQMHIKMDDKEYEQLKKDADQRGMNLSEYVRSCLHRQSGVELSISFADIDRYASAIEKLVNTVCGLAPILWDSGKAYGQDITAILRSVQEINRLCNDTWRYVVDTRTQLYDEVRAKLYQSVKQNRYSRRRKFSTDAANNRPEKKEPNAPPQN